MKNVDENNLYNFLMAAKRSPSLDAIPLSDSLSTNSSIRGDTAKVLVRLCVGTDSPEPSLLDNAISTVDSEIFTKVLFSRSFGKIKSTRNGEIAQSFTDKGISSRIREFLVSLICLLTLFSKIKISRKFPDLQ